LKVTLKGQIAYKRKEGFIGHGQPNDPKHQQEKDRDVPIVGDPCKGEVHEKFITSGEGFVQVILEKI
jgi:hypothetical protein